MVTTNTDEDNDNNSNYTNQYGNIDETDDDNNDNNNNLLSSNTKDIDKLPTNHLISNTDKNYNCF